MNNRHILILSVILGVLVLGVLVKDLFSRIRDRTAAGVHPPLSFTFDPEKIGRIEIGRGVKKFPVTLVKKGSGWQVKDLWNAKADDPKVSELLEGLRGMKGELRSSDASALADFGITDADAFSLMLGGSDGGTIMDLRIGSRRAGHDGAFFRRAGSSEVYYTETGLDRILGVYFPAEEQVPDPAFWADLALFNLAPDEVSRIEINGIKGGTSVLSLGIERTADGWKLIGPHEKRPVDPGKVLGYIAILNSVRAQGIEDPAGKSYGLEQPVWRLTVTAGGKQQVLEAGPQRTKGNVYFMKFRDRPEVFRLTAYYFEDLNVKNDHFSASDGSASGGEKTNNQETIIKQ